MKQTTLIPHLSSTELFRRYRNCKNVQEARRWHILWLISTHTPVNTVATTTGMGRTWIWHICTRYNAMGPIGVRRQQAIAKRKPNPSSIPCNLINSNKQ
jgi:hypothetical protein